jgi:hypothetical protein
VDTLLKLNLETFTLTPVGDPNHPEITALPSSVYDGVRFIYFFGGYLPTSQFPTNGITQFDTLTLTSRFIPVKNFPVGEEKARYFLTAPDCVYVKQLNRIYCFGGKVNGGHAFFGKGLNDIFYIDNPQNL